MVTMYKMFLFVLLLFFCFTIKSQEKLSSHGGVFTPKGDLKLLIVPVVFKDKPQSNPLFNNNDHFLKGWASENLQKLPDDVDPDNGESVSWMFNRPEHFEIYKDSSFFNDSKLFYHISKGKFRLMADFFRDTSGRPISVEIDPIGGSAWAHMNKKAFDKMKIINPDFDFSPFDNRKNNPQYLFDNSINPEPDNTVDYIIFIYRYSPNWSQQPAPAMNRWTGSGGGFASPAGIQLERFNGYKFNEGFTMTWGSGVFFHELAHTLYNVPHIWGSNNTVGEYFYGPTIGWGATSTIALFKVPSAWETWFMGYIELLADIKSPDDLRNGNAFELRDYCTFGDAMRVEIPFSRGQYLWLEYHSTKHPFDNHVWKGLKVGTDRVVGAAPGVYAYVEDVSSSRNDIPGVLSPVCNAIKPLNAAGNYDYEFIDEKPQKNAWGNNLYKFRRLEANPVSGTNPFFYFKADFNKDGVIGFDRNYNGAPKNEGEPIHCEQIYTDSFANLYQSFGVYSEQWDYSRSPAFRAGDKLGVCTNPPLLNHVKYDYNKMELDPFILNGLEIKFIQSDFPDRIVVLVNFKKVEIEKNVRWTGNILVPDITKDYNPDLVLKKRKTLLLNKSATVNRHLKNNNGLFINDTYLKISKNTKLKLEKKSKIVLDDGAILELEPGGKIIFGKKARIIVKKGSKIILNGNEIIQRRNLIVNTGGKLIE